MTRGEVDVPWQIRLIIAVIIFAWVLWMTKDMSPYREFWQWFINTIVFVGKIVLIIVGIVVGGYIVYKIYDWWSSPDMDYNTFKSYSAKKDENNLNEMEKQSNLVSEVVRAIEEFNPPKRYENEEGYHHTLFAWLKAKFPNAKMEYQVGSSRPDIVIDGIAIEIKGPTTTKDLQTIADKILRYRRYFDYIIIVLFDVRVRSTRYHEWYEGLSEFPNVIVIRKDFKRYSAT